MPQFIDKNKLKEMIEAKADTLIDGRQAFLYIAKWLDILPAAEAVEVVRCKDCKHYKYGVCTYETNTVYCMECGEGYSLMRLEDHYCSYGERRE